MALFEGKTPAERNKAIAAIALGAVALLSLVYMFFGSSSGTKVSQANSNSRKTANAPSSAPSSPSGSPVPAPAEVRQNQVMLEPVSADRNPPAQVPESERNIFAYYEPTPTPTPMPSPVIIPVPSPTPSPPLLLASVSPSNVYARTGDFTLQVSGDKFTPACHLTFDGRDLQTEFRSAQQLSATVPAALIGSEGGRQIGVHTPDGRLYSNTATLNVAAPPAPNYSYIGTLISKGRGHDVAMLQDKGSKELLNVQRGDVVGGRFRVTSISEREVQLVDTTLRVKHTVPFTGGTSETGNRAMQPNRPPTRPTETDEEP